MFGSLTTNAIDQVSVVEELIGIHDAVINEREPQVRLRMKVYAVSSCATRLYAIYENFVESIISDYLDAIPELQPYSSLAEGLKTEYRIGISHVLNRIENERYDHLVHENVIRWYHDALTGAVNYRFVTEALTHHEHNLRLQVLDALLSRIQLKELRGWITHSEHIRRLYSEQTSVYEQLESEVKGFVQLRNDAAHGQLDSFEGRDNLKRYCDLVRSLILAISSYFHRSLILKKVQAGKAQKIGDVTEVFSKAGAFIAQIGATAGIRKGMKVHFVGSDYCFSEEIRSLRVNDVDVESVVADCDRFEVGVKCLITPRLRAEIYVLT